MILYQKSPQAHGRQLEKDLRAWPKWVFSAGVPRWQHASKGPRTWIRSVGISKYNGKHPPWLAALFLHRYAFLTQGNFKVNILWYVFVQYVIDITNFSSCVSITFAIMSPLFEKCIVNLLLNWKEEKLMKISVTQSTFTQSTLKG